MYLSKASLYLSPLCNAFQTEEMFAVLGSAQRLQLQSEEADGAAVAVLVSAGAGAGLVPCVVAKVRTLSVRVIERNCVIL